MWDNEYRDYKPDLPIKKVPLETNKGIIGCEMNEIYGWGNSLHKPHAKKRKNIFSSLLSFVKKKGKS